jgi:hypothetical protein
MNTKTVGRVAPLEPIKQEVVKQAAEKASVEKVAAEKTASTIGSFMGSDAAKSFVGNVAGGLGAVAAIGVANLASSKINKMVSSAEYKRALDKAISINPRLQQRPRAELEQYFGLIVEASPSVARNPLLVANYLEFLLDHQGQLNYTAYTNLVNLESQILSNRTNSNPLTGQVQKAVVDASVRGAFDNYAKADKRDIENRAHQKGFDAAVRRYNIQP